MFENAMTVTGHSWRVSSTGLRSPRRGAWKRAASGAAKARRWLDRLRRRATARVSGDGSHITRASRMDMTSLALARTRVVTFTFTHASTAVCRWPAPRVPPPIVVPTVRYEVEHRDASSRRRGPRTCARVSSLEARGAHPVRPLACFLPAPIHTQRRHRPLAILSLTFACVAIARPNSSSLARAKQATCSIVRKTRSIR